jgi:2-iminobutanoate/2-iminopropanoate deaminase
VTDRAWLKDYMVVRDRHVANPPPASTLMIVSGFAAEIYKVEVEVIAAAP